MSFDGAINPIREEQPETGTTNRRRLILGSSAAVVALAAITTTSVCATGNCRRTRGGIPDEEPTVTTSPTPEFSARSVPTLTPTSAPSDFPSSPPSDIPSLQPSDVPSGMPSLESSIAQTAIENMEEGCSVTECYIVNLETEIETLLTGDDSYVVDDEGTATYSIRCDANEELAFFDFLYGGTTFREWNAPFWMAGNDGDDWVVPVDALSSCGDTSFSIAASTSADESICVEKSFTLTTLCGSTDAPENVAQTVIVAAQEQDCSLAGCYLLNLDTDVETLLTGDDSYVIDPEDADSFSIRCETNEEIAYLDFVYGDNISFREWNTPYWMAGNSGDDWVEPVEGLSLCGDKSFRVVGATGADQPTCLDESFQLVASCSSTTGTTSSQPESVAQEVVAAVQEEETFVAKASVGTDDPEATQAVEEEEEQQPEEVACSLASCYLFNIDTGIETLLTGKDNFEPNGSDSYSIRCDPTDEGVSYLEFKYDGKTHRESNGPHWMNGNSGDSWVEPVDQLGSCGQKDFRITTSESKGESECAEQLYELTALC